MFVVSVITGMNESKISCSVFIFWVSNQKIILILVKGPTEFLFFFDALNYKHWKTQSWMCSKKKKKTLWPLFIMDGVQLPQGYSHFEVAVYFLPFSSQKFLVLIQSTTEGWKAESTLRRSHPVVLSTGLLDWKVNDSKVNETLKIYQSWVSNSLFLILIVE